MWIAKPRFREIKSLTLSRQWQNRRIVTFLHPDSRDIGKTEWKDQVVTAQSDLVLTKKHDFLAAHFAFQESTRNDRDKER
jgi:hypothetical protein